ncbi:hypothetical protein LCGC14_2639820 [marine sediment metagenome]|uniref:Uncharacterized protein n=1 Tax=marine sediment metagenome TaxID=412755 RepID=A0A0F9CQ34_9ZZZZ
MTTSQAKAERNQIREMFEMGMLTPRQRFEMDFEVKQAANQYYRLSK